MPIAGHPYSFLIEFGEFYEVLNASYCGRYECVCWIILDCKAPVFKWCTNMNLNINQEIQVDAQSVWSVHSRRNYSCI